MSEATWLADQFLRSVEGKAWHGGSLMETLQGVSHTLAAASPGAGRHGIWLEDLFVYEEFRGAGYGKALLCNLAALCVERGYPRLEWWVLDWNTPSIEFYHALGATPMDEWTTQRVTGGALRQLARRGQ